MILIVPCFANLEPWCCAIVSLNMVDSDDGRLVLVSNHLTTISLSGVEGGARSGGALFENSTEKQRFFD